MENFEIIVRDDGAGVAPDVMEACPCPSVLWALLDPIAVYVQWEVGPGMFGVPAHVHNVTPKGLVLESGPVLVRGADLVATGLEPFLATVRQLHAKQALVSMGSPGVSFPSFALAGICSEDDKVTGYCLELVTGQAPLPYSGVALPKAVLNAWLAYVRLAVPARLGEDAFQRALGGVRDLCTRLGKQVGAQLTEVLAEIERDHALPPDEGLGVLLLDDWEAAGGTETVAQIRTNLMR